MPASSMIRTISIHALLAESDLLLLTLADASLNFYPRSPCGERRYVWLHLLKDFCISIHALLAESDRWLWVRISLFDNFYPRSPCGERPKKQSAAKQAAAISIHALLAESDRLQNPIEIQIVISIHALLAESDLVIFRSSTGSAAFLSTLSLRRATIDWTKYNKSRIISIHALLAESDTICRPSMSSCQ